MPDPTVGQIIDALGVQPDGLNHDVLISDAIIILKCHLPDGTTTLWTGDNNPDWITRVGMLRAATQTEEPAGYRRRDIDEN